MAGKIVEISGDTTKLTLPIAKFPPFKLRSLLIERDPAAFAHLIDTFIRYFEVVNLDDNLSKLHETSLNQLIDFIGSYIHEMANEAGLLLSLQTSTELNETMHTLRAWVFHTIRVCGLFYLRIFGKTLWELVVLYVEKNPKTIWSMLDGSHKPQLHNAQKYQLNRIDQIQQYLKELVEKNEFKRLDLLTVQYLLRDDTAFASKFMTVNWIEYLEAWWDKGNGKLAVISQELMLTTLLSVDTNTIVALCKRLQITDLESLVTYPLLGTLMTNDKFLKRRPELKQKLKYLNLADYKEKIETLEDHLEQPENLANVREEDLESLGTLFPQLSKYQLSQLLLRYDSNVELITNLLFDDPSLVDQIPRDNPPTVRTTPQVKSAPVDLELHEDFLRRNNKPAGDITVKRVPDEVRNKTLARALELLYENDHDEVDDTYDEAEVERSKTVGKISLKEDAESDSDDEADDSNEIDSKYDRIEGYLWNLLKEDSQLFSRDKRGTKVRKAMRSETGWSDEQIEGWARMLERSPQRARILEEKFMFRGNVRKGKTSYVKNRDNGAGVVANSGRAVIPSSEKEHRRQTTRTNKSEGKTKNGNDNRKDKSKDSEEGKKNKQQQGEGKQSSKGTNEKRKYARNERQKASRANHNRRAQHDKKMVRAGLP